MSQGHLIAAFAAIITGGAMLFGLFRYDLDPLTLLLGYACGWGGYFGGALSTRWRS